MNWATIKKLIRCTFVCPIRQEVSDEIVDGVVLDFAGNGTLVGIDLQQASQKADIYSIRVIVVFAFA